MQLPLKAPTGSVIASGSIRNRMPMVGRLEVIVKPTPLSSRRPDLPESARDAIEQMRTRLLEGSSVVVFPEGTRSPDGSVAPFREGAFRLAIESRVDVVPLAIEGTDHALPRHSLRFRPTAASVTVLAPSL